MTRKKADKTPAASSLPQAIDLLTRFAALDGEMAARKARVDAAVAQMRAEADALDAPLKAEQKVLFNTLKPWWPVSGEDVTGGLRKSAELGGCLIGHRTSNPALEFPRPEANAVRLLMEQGWKGLLRIKVELDKAAIMTAIRWTAAGRDVEGFAQHGDAEDVDLTYARRWFEAVGFSISQKEEFFIDRLPPRGQAVEVVADPAAEQVPA